MSWRFSMLGVGLPVLLAGGVLADAAWGGRGEPSEREAAAGSSASLAADDRIFWGMHWERFAGKFAVVDGEAFMCARWDGRFVSSAHISISEWAYRNTRRHRVLDEEVIVWVGRAQGPPPEEALAAAAVIPVLAPGQYGYIHSARVERILGPREMIVGDVWLVDAGALAEAKAVAERRLLRINPREAASARLEDDRRAVRELGLDDRLEPFRFAERQLDPRLRSPGTEQAERRLFRSETVAPRDPTERRAQVVRRAEVSRALLWRYGERDRAAARQRAFGGKTLRLVGFPTEGLSEGERWSEADNRWGGLRIGPQIAIIKHDRSERAGGNGRDGRFAGGSPSQLVAVNGAEFRRAMTEQEFVDLLSDRGLSVGQFVRMARPLMREHGAAVDPYILHALEEARAETEAAVEGERPEGEGRSRGPGSFEQWFREKYAETDAEAHAAEEAGDPVEDEPAGAGAAEEERMEPANDRPPSRSGFEQWYRERFGGGTVRADSDGTGRSEDATGGDGDAGGSADDPRGWFERKHGGAGEDD